MHFSLCYRVNYGLGENITRSGKRIAAVVASFGSTTEDGKRITTPTTHKLATRRLFQKELRSASLAGFRQKLGEVLMRNYLAAGLGMVAGFGLGVVAIQGLHAQAKPTVYLVTEIDVTNPEAYGTEFAPKAQATIRAAGGRLIAIGGAGGAGAKEVVSLEGTPPKRLTIQAWDSMDAVKSWFNSADYQAALKIGQQYAKFRRFAIEGTQ